MNDTAQTDNLSMKYNYAQLDPAHKAIADQIAALLVAYPDIVKLNDPAAQQKFMSDVEQSGVGKALQGLGDAGSTITQKIHDAGIPIVSSMIGAAQTTTKVAGAASDAAEGFGKGKDIALSPASIPGAGLSTFINEAKVIFNDMTPEKARDIGAHYASVLQAQQQNRTKDSAFGYIGDAFGGFHSTDAEHPYMSAASNGASTLWAYISAGVAWAFESISGMVTGKPARSFAEHLNHALFNTDIAAVRDNMAKATDLPHAETYAQALTQGAEMQNRAGTNTTLNAPTADTTTPTLPDAPKDAHAKPVVVAADKGAVLADAGNKAGTAVKQEAQATFGGIDTPAKAIGAVAGTAAVIDGARGVAHGIKRAPVVAAEKHAIRAETQAEKLQKQVASLEQRLAPDSAERKLHRTVAAAGEKVGHEGMGAREQKWEAGLNAKLETAREQAVKVTATADHARETADAARATLKPSVSKLHVPSSESGFWARQAYKLANLPHNIGRAIGDKIYNWGGKRAVEDLQAIRTNIGNAVEGIKHAPETLKSAPEQFHAGTAQGQSAHATAALEKSKAALEAAKAELAQHQKAAAGDGWFGWMRTAGNRAKEAQLAKVSEQRIAALEGKMHEALGRGVARAIEHEATALPHGATPNIFHRIGSWFGGIKESALSFMDRTASAAAHAAPKAETVAKGAETVAEVSKVAAERAEGKGPWGKIIIAVAALFGGAAAGVAEAAEPTKPGENKTLNVTKAAVRGGLWDTLGGMVGLPDFAKGDVARGVGSLASWIPLVPGTAVVDTFRQVDKVEKVPAADVAKIDGLVTAQTKKTGNVYLDRVIALKAMQARGVKEVAMAPMNNINPIWSTDNMGEVAHEGAAFPVMSADAPQEITASVKEAIDTNLRLYLVKGGNLAAAQQATGAKPTLSNEEILAAHDGVVHQARMAVNRGTTERKLVAFNVGTAVTSAGAVHHNGLPNPTGGSAAQSQQHQRANA